jgi:holo-[acyl-carrier protein] synthase
MIYGAWVGSKELPAYFMEAGTPPLVVGTDIVEVQDVRRALAEFGERYFNRVFTSAEITYCLGRGRNAACHFAARFAAKEAAMKVLRPGPDDAIPWKHIESVRCPDGHCELALSGRARARADREGFQGFSMSLSHEAEYATAVVVGYRKEGFDARPA